MVKQEIYGSNRFDDFLSMKAKKTVVDDFNLVDIRDLLSKNHQYIFPNLDSTDHKKMLDQLSWNSELDVSDSLSYALS